MNKKIKRITAVLLMFVLVGLMPFAAGHTEVYAAKEKDFKVEAHYGYNDSIQVRCYVPFYITVENIDDNFEGTVQVIVPKNDYNVMYEKDISLAKGSEKTVMLTVPIVNYMEQVNVRIVNQKDKVVWDERVKCNILYSLKTLNIGVLSDDFTALSYMSGQQLFSYSDIKTTIYEMSAETMPDEWMALQMLDAIVISNFSSDKLSEAQVAALGTWVNEGGLLILGTGSTANKTLSGLNGNIVNVKTGELKSYNTKFGYSLLSFLDGTGNEDIYLYDKYFNIDDEAFNSIEDLIREWIKNALVADALDEYDYETVFWQFYEEHKEELASLCKTDFLYSYYGMKTMPDEEWQNYGENDFCYCLIEMFRNPFALIIDELKYEQIIEDSADIGYVDADVLEFTISQNAISKTTIFYGETSANDRLYPLVQATAVGEGYIAVAGIDFTQNPFCTYKGNSLIFLNIIKTLIGNEVYKEADSYSVDYYYDDDFDYEIRSVVNMASSPSAPPVIVYVFILGVYLVLCLVVYFVLKKKKKNMLLWIVQPVMAVVFALVIFVIGFTTRITKPELNVVAITDIEDNYEYVKSYATITMPKNRSYELDFSKKYNVQLAALERRWYYNYSNQSMNLDSYYLGINSKPDVTNIELRNTQSLSTESFELDRTEYIEGTVTASFTENNAARLYGTVTNNYGVDLENAFVFYNGYFYALGDVENGETVTLEEGMDVLYENNYYRYDSGYEYLLGDASFDIKTVIFGSSSQENKREVMKRSFCDYVRGRLIYSHDNYGYNYSYYLGALIFAFPAESDNKAVQADEGKIKEHVYEIIRVKIPYTQIENSTIPEVTEMVDYKYYY